jgi:hypothetical protein
MAKLPDWLELTELPAEETDYRMASESSILRWWHIPAGRDVTGT